MVGAESIGERLKAARLEQGFSIDQVVEKTRINRNYITALENDDHAAIPADFYAVSFLRQYSEVLGLPSGDMVSALRQKLADIDENPGEFSVIQVSATSHTLWSAAFEKIRRGTREFIVSRRNAVAAAALMLVGGLGWWYVGFSDPAVTTPRPEAASVESPRTTEPDGEFAAAPVPEVSEGVASPGTAELSASSAAVPVAEVSEGVELATAPAAPVPEPAPIDSAETLAIQMRASGEVWVRTVVDGGRPREAILQAGDLRTFRPLESLKFTVGNARAITLVVNGQEQASIGERGQVRHIQVDRDGWKALPAGSF